MSFLICIIAAIAAALAGQVAVELRMRSMAAARAYGQKLERTGLGLGSWPQVLADIRKAAALRMERALPQPLIKGLAERLALAGDNQGPGSLIATMLAYALIGLSLGLLLDMGAYTGAMALLGLALPLIRIQDLASRRQAALRRQLPDALDLLTACVEAGLGFDQALARVAIRLKAGSLRTELEATVTALGLGASRREALRELERRLHLEELSQLVAALLQADKRGAPLGPALRAQSGQLRRLRTLRVKKLAAEAPLKMLFPLMVFILPVVFIVLFGPIALKWKAGGF